MARNKQIKIFLDPQIFYLQSFGGISRIFAELWHYCNKQSNVQIVCPLEYSNNLHLNEYGLAPGKQLVKNRNTLKNKIIHALQKRINVAKAVYYLITKKYDVVLTTYYGPYFMPFKGKKPVLLTVFDMTHERFPHYFENEKHVMAQKKALCIKADKVAAISQSTKEDILYYYPQVPASKIDVVHLSQSISTANERAVQWLPHEYILFVGRRSHYKQFDVLLKAMLPIFEQYPHLQLVCAGGGQFSQDERNMLDLYKVESRVVQHNFQDNELYTIYKNARLFVFPSEYEGFGIPTLEAMQCGCPIILSTNSSLPEIGGEAAAYFETNNVPHLTQEILKILENDLYRNELIKKGYEQIKKFSWEKMSMQYIEICNQLLEK